MRCYNCGTHGEPIRSLTTGQGFCPGCGVLLERGQYKVQRTEYGKKEPFFRTVRALEVCRITMAWSFGFITNAERQKMVDELMNQEPELPFGYAHGGPPLGIGAATEDPGCRTMSRTS